MWKGPIKNESVTTIDLHLEHVIIVFEMGSGGGRATTEDCWTCMTTQPMHNLYHDMRVVYVVCVCVPKKKHQMMLVMIAMLIL